MRLVAYLKDGVCYPHTKEIDFAIYAISQICSQQNWPLPTITSGHDGQHMKGSKHYEGLAIDVRTRGYNAKFYHVLVRAAIASFGFDVVLEKDHIHIEYDPKGSTQLMTYPRLEVKEGKIYV